MTAYMYSGLKIHLHPRQNGCESAEISTRSRLIQMDIEREKYADPEGT